MTESRQLLWSRTLFIACFLLFVVSYPSMGQEASVNLNNSEQSDHAATSGMLYFDNNYYPDYSELSGDGGGLGIYTNGQWGAVLSTENTPHMKARFHGVTATHGLRLHTKKKFGGDYPTDNANVNNAFILGGASHETFQIFRQNSGQAGTFCGSKNFRDCYVFMQSDGNGNHPDGGILFGGVGQDDVFEPHLMIRGNGRLGVGTTRPGEKLAVNGRIKAKEVIVETGWADFVFEESYDLPTLEEMERHVEQNGHLPGIPSAEEVAKNGVQLGAMDAKLLQKIEELVLHTFRQQEQIDAQRKQIQTQQEQIDRLLQALEQETPTP